MPYPYPLSAEDTNALITYSELPDYTPDQATHIQAIMGTYATRTPKRIRWLYPNMGIYLSKRIITPLHPDQPSKPESLESQQPWLDERITRSAWFARRRLKQHLAQYLVQLPPLYDQDREGLNLHRALSRFAASQHVEFNRLWVAVCEVLRPLVLEANRVEVPGLRKIEDLLKTPLPGE